MMIIDIHLVINCNFQSLQFGDNSDVNSCVAQILIARDRKLVFRLCWASPESKEQFNVSVYSVVFQFDLFLSHGWFGSRSWCELLSHRLRLMDILVLATA